MSARVGGALRQLQQASEELPLRIDECGLRGGVREGVIVRWWREELWRFIGVRVAVRDDGNRIWGQANLWGVESGTFPYKIDVDTGAVESIELDPLRDKEHPMPDLIEEAMGEARERLRTMRRAHPKIKQPRSGWSRRTAHRRGSATATTLLEARRMNLRDQPARAALPF